MYVSLMRSNIHLIIESSASQTYFSLLVSLQYVVPYKSMRMNDKPCCTCYNESRKCTSYLYVNINY